MASELDGRHCKLTANIRDASGKMRSKEESITILKTQISLGKTMYLCLFQDGSSTYLFSEEFSIID